MNGRPLRFLIAMLGLWVALRTAMLWPVVEPRLAMRAPERLPLPKQAPASLAAPLAPSWVRPASALIAPGRALAARHAAPQAMSPLASDPMRVALAMLALTRIGPAEPIVGKVEREAPSPARFIARAQPTGDAKRWSASGWLIARSGTGLGASPLAGQLGGSQAGLRFGYAVDEQRRLGVVARAATPLAGPGREAAIGIEWQPTRAPIRVIAEQRIGLDRGLGGPAIGVVGGVGPIPIGDFRLEAYGQAGVIGREQGIGYADGAARIERPLLKRRGIAFSAGAGLWGAAQPGAERLDIGPLIGVSVPVARQRVRFSLEWRERIGGRALPGSGPTVSIGSDF